MIKLKNWRGLEATLTLSFHRRYIGRPFTSTMERRTQDLDMDERASLNWGMAEMPPFEGGLLNWSDPRGAMLRMLRRM
jgi:hypothetical protein